jgi:sn-glycerol 3-phosphate transport system substrate-binding protein
MMKRYLSLAATGFAAYCAAALFSGAALAATKIEYFFPVAVDGKLAKEMTEMVKRFNAQQSDVDVVAVYTGSYDETKIKAQAALQAGRPPAVALVSANFVLEFKLNDQIVPLDPLLAADGTTKDKFLEDFWPALRPNATVDGKLYAIPFQNSTPLLYYNVDLFKEAGLDPDKPPRTWADVIDYARKLTKRNGDKVERWGLMLPGSYDYLGWLVSALTMSNGGLYYNPNYGGEVYYDSPSTLGALRFIDDLVHKYRVMPEGVIDGKDVPTAFFGNQVAMTILSTGSLSFIRENMKAPFKVGFIPRNIENAAPIGGGSLVTFKGVPDDQRKAAWTFMKWLSAPEQLASWSRFTGYFAPRESSYELPEMKAFTAKNPEALIALDQLNKFGRPWFATFNTVAVRKAMEDEVQAVLSGKKKPEEAVKEAQRKADEIMLPYVQSTALTASPGG